MRKTILLLTLLFFSSAHSGLKTPSDFFGFQPGADRMLFDYEKLIAYLQLLDESSAQLKLVNIGESPMGRPMYMALISSEENISRLEELKTINKKLALSGSLADDERRQLISDGKVFVLATLSMHSSEVGPSQAAPLIAHELITTTDPEISEWLNNCVFMMVPCHNPDGMDMIVEHYQKYKETKYDGATMPGIYHKYVGHDNNRDFVTLSQKDTKAIARIYNLDWFPQVLVEKHQMGWYTARYFVPPMHDPIAENIDAELWNWMTIFGANMITDMTREGCSGVSQHYLFDDYWPGSTETALWKNVIAMLTEAASARYATPIFVEPSELRGFGKGLAEYKKSINMPQPWPGGWWRLSDIVHYEIVSTKSILKTAAANREAILAFRNNLCKKEIEKGKTKAPFYFIFPNKQQDESEYRNLLTLLQEHGVQLFRLAQDVEVNGSLYCAGDVVIPLAQPFRAFIKEVLEKQTFPLRHYTPGGEIIKPYDITSWSLPLHRGIKAIKIDTKSESIEEALVKVPPILAARVEAPKDYRAALFDVNNNESYKAAFAALAEGLKTTRLTAESEIGGRLFGAGSFIIAGKMSPKLLQSLTVPPLFIEQEILAEQQEISMPKIALVETWFHDMDAGWTRFIFDQYNIPFDILRPGDMAQLKSNKYDVIVFPDADKDILTHGKYKTGDAYKLADYPPEFTRGIGKKGMQKLAAYINDGGLVLSWGRSTRLFCGELEYNKNEKESASYQLPVRDISDNAVKGGLYCPGSLCRVELLQGHPLTFGLPRQTGIFYRGRPLFATSVPAFDMDRRVIASFPEKEILISGYCEKEKLLAQKAVLVWMRKGKGQVILYGFSPQFRASTQAAFKLLFNGLLMAK